MKTCPSCETTKSLDMFSKASARHDGLQSQCKSCRSAKRKADYIKNKDREIALNKVWQKNNPDSVKATRKKHYDNNTEYYKARSIQYRRDNPVWAKAIDKVAGKKWRAANRGNCNARSAQYRANKLNATPAWLTDEHKDDIKTMYVLAKKFEKLCNIRYHVDHIVPLAGKDVCGLHVPWNLQLLPASVNIAKGNKHNEEALRK